MVKKKFHIGDVLSIVGDVLLSPSKPPIDGVYGILNFMTHDNFFTHQLIRARDEARPFLLRQFPQLADYDDSSVNRDNWQKFLAAQVKKYGEFLEVEPLPEGAYVHKDALAEIVALKGADSVIVVKH